ncbi:AraC family transcriptional regulator ligand-binding domain-containing protein [Herbaspirillum sp. GCM10030257]|uniref:helix-turn-helix transcriptional regulator n=1 Tax=Herbaspirillum sp. GCM10030257 TaxID=3273393 RepID=UPI00361F2CF9
MKTARARSLRSATVPRGLAERLLDELQRNAAASGTALSPADATALDQLAASQLSADRFAALYGAAIEQLETQVAHGDGHAPMRKEEVALMCRCLLSCRTLAEAIRCAADFCAMLHPRAGKLDLIIEGTSAIFHMDSLRRRRSSAACLVDLTGVLCYLQLFSWLIGQPLRPGRIFLAHPRREDAMPFLGLFNASVSVGEKTYGFNFDSTLLTRPVLRQPAELEAFLVDFPFRPIGASPALMPVTQQVRGFLEAALAREQALPSQADVAGLLGISQATLRRRLTEEDSSYHALREHCLREAAERYLRHTDWSIGHIAGYLGFGSEAAFRRAFQRWSGHAPSRLRRDMPFDGKASAKP